MPGAIIPARFAALVVAVLAVVAVLTYGALAGWAIIQVWTAVDVAPVPNEAVTYVESALAGLVGGIVATAFGISPPSRKLSGISNLSTAGATSGQLVGVIYVVIYFLVGIASIIAFVFQFETSSDLVKNLALIALGMIIPIVVGFFANNAS